MASHDSGNSLWGLRKLSSHGREVPKVFGDSPRGHLENSFKDVQLSHPLADRFEEREKGPLGKFCLNR